jgi:hypothetical protein
MAWGFDNLAEFEAQTTRYLAGGIPRNERLMFVADDPKPGQWPATVVDSGQLVIASTTEVYGADRIVDPLAQRATFHRELVAAVTDGYTGIRVAADNSSLVAGHDRIFAWMEWEAVGDEFMANHPVSGLCAFDRSRVEPATLRQLLDAHHTTLASPSSTDLRP